MILICFVFYYEQEILVMCLILNQIFYLLLKMTWPAYIFKIICLVRILFEFEKLF